MKSKSVERRQNGSAEKTTVNGTRSNGNGNGHQDNTSNQMPAGQPSIASLLGISKTETSGLDRAMLLLALTSVDEPPRQVCVTPFRDAVNSLWQGMRSPVILSVCLLIFLFEFNPFSATVQNVYTVR